MVYTVSLTVKTASDKAFGVRVRNARMRSSSEAVSTASGLWVDGFKATESRGEERWDSGRLLDGAVDCESPYGSWTANPRDESRHPQVIRPQVRCEDELPGEAHGAIRWMATTG